MALLDHCGLPSVVVVAHTCGSVAVVYVEVLDKLDFLREVGEESRVSYLLLVRNFYRNVGLLSLLISLVYCCASPISISIWLLQARITRFYPSSVGGDP